VTLVSPAIEIAAPRPRLGLRGVLANLLELPRHELGLRLTLLLLLLHGAQTWDLDVSLSVLCGIAIVCTPLSRSTTMWLVISAALTWSNALHWNTIDNHKYLITYWCYVCALATTAGDPVRVMSVNARLMVGLAFALAVLWKLVAGQYLDGSFLYFEFLAERRLGAACHMISDLTWDDLERNQRLLSQLSATLLPEMSIRLAGGEHLRRLTLAMSYWTLLIEGLVALAFLLPRSTRPGGLRDVFLMVFIGTTYFLLPVAGFAFVLTLLGLMQCDRPAFRKLYLVLFVGVQLVQVPWIPWIAGWLDPAVAT
jgi:hypothetical protein